jgi:hypothetical protein
LIRHTSLREGQKRLHGTGSAGTLTGLPFEAINLIGVSGFVVTAHRQWLVEMPNGQDARNSEGGIGDEP